MNGSILWKISVVVTIALKVMHFPGQYGKVANIAFTISLISTILQWYSFGIMHNFTYSEQDKKNMPNWAIVLNLCSSIIEFIIYSLFLILIILTLAQRIM